MIDAFQLLRNTGRFESFAGTAATRLAAFSVVYAENGRGKTTLAEILRSLQTGDPTPIQERRRLGSAHPPHVVITLASGTAHTFQDDLWSAVYPNLVIFDDFFTYDNVYSGLEVTAANRQQMHQVILGREGVRLAREMEAKTEEIADLGRQLRTLESEFARTDLEGLSVSEFCELEVDPGAAEALADAQRRLAALQDQVRIANAAGFGPFAPPTFPLEELAEVLRASIDDIDATAMASVQSHLQKLGATGESWLRQGRSLEPLSDGDCPYCAQDLAGSVLVGHYGAYFGQAYSDFMRSVSQLALTIGERFDGDSLAGYLRTMEDQRAAHGLWSQHLELSPFDIDPEGLASLWQRARDSVLELVRAKMADPFTRLEVDADTSTAVGEYNESADAFRRLSQALVGRNQQIRELQAEVAGGDINVARRDVDTLRRSVARTAQENVDRCAARMMLVSARAQEENEKARAREALDAHRVTVFPRYETAINDYLRRFNAGFRIVQMQPTNPRGIPSSEYFVEINNERVGITGAPGAGEPSFKSTLSAGDRSTLSFCFFLASLTELDLTDMVVVVDDPLSSLDDYRTAMTTQEIRTIAERAAQVIVLSHSKRLLCSLASGVATPAALEIRRDGDGSTLVPWQVHDEAVTENDQRAALTREYVRTGGTREEAKRVAQALRPQLEAFLRVAAAEHFQPGSMLGPYIRMARQAIEAGRLIAPVVRVDELDELREYTNRFHHDTNTAWDTSLADLNEQELQGFAERVLAFTSL